ncbi:hypothetical protein [Kitasatospora sp. CB02891]|uniref:hypothetical protein n=1 Tax=Kitasatospora sp. CB02891 TaxID=2020329 RepID=UPI000C27BBDF|nr:hypothetical protein [Kitasatospora sp. CB02891]PJN25676.1 hypothetical protein CG736_15020 [Kitasatospora sp. CB02891]
MIVPVVFAVPLISKQIALDWAAVQRNLRRTIRTVLGTDDQNAMVVVAHAEKPEGDFWDSDRVVSLPVDLPCPTTFDGARLDKKLKRTLIGVWLKRNSPATGAVIVVLDADDLVSPRLVPFIRENSSGCGLRIDRGWRLDMITRRAREHQVRFSAYCGSSFAGFFAKDELPDSLDDMNAPYRLVVVGHHREFGERYREATARPVIDVDFPAMVYPINQSESLNQRATSTAVRRMNLDRAISAEETRLMLERDFAVMDLWPEAGRPDRWDKAEVRPALCRKLPAEGAPRPTSSPPRR